MLEKVCETGSTAFVIPLTEGPSRTVTIGRHEDNDLVLNDMSISRRHAVLNIYGGGEIALSDCGSKFGTFVQFRRDLEGCREVSLMKDRFSFDFYAE